MLVSHKDGGTYHSNAIHIDDLAQCLNDSLFGIKSAAYCTSSEFALSSHDHDIYTSAMYQSVIGSHNARTIMKMVDLTHGEIPYFIDISSVVDGTEVPETKKRQLMNAILPYLPKLGTIEFVCANDVTAYSKYRDYFNVSSKNFIGWTYANGQTYDMTSFILSNNFSNVFQCTGSTFKVPSLSNYICKASCQLDGNSSYSYVPGEETPLIGHSHEIVKNGNSTSLRLDSENIDIDDEDLDKLFTHKLGGSRGGGGFTPKFAFENNASTENKWSFGKAKGNSAFNTVHNGSASGTTSAVYLVDSQHIDDMPLNDLAIVPEEGVEGEIAYPSHMLMPAVIFVGPSISSDLIKSYLA